MRLYNKYTEVFDKSSKGKKDINESMFTAGGLLEIMNLKNLLVILNLDDYVYIDPSKLAG